MATQHASPVLSPASFQAIQRLDTCLVSNAIERLHVRMRNEGSVSGSAVRCQFPGFAPMLGYAVTGRLRSSVAPVYGRCYHENISWWRYLASIPEPRVMVLQDVDERPGSGALVGELHAAIGLGLHCIGYVTNGSVRDLPEVEALGFHLFSGSVSVTHQYAHVSEFGKPVEIGGCTIAPGDLIHGDRHGVHIIPLSIAGEIPQIAGKIVAEEKDLVKFCASRRFSLKALEHKLENSPGGGCQVPIG
jgi:regulator of RNase E activity RraA